MSQDSLEEVNAWWTSVRHGGMLLSAPVIQEMLPEGPEIIPEDEIIHLRDEFAHFQADPKNRLRKWLDYVFETFLELNPGRWQKETRVHATYKLKSVTKEILRPNRVLRDPSGEDRYFLKIDEMNKRVGIGRGRREYGKFIELLKEKVQIGILTNGYQFRLVYAGLDHDSWMEWDTERWFDDPTNQVLTSFKTLCGKKLNTGKFEEKWPLLYWIQQSRKKQGDLATVLGEQIREAVEALLESLGEARQSIPGLLNPLLIDPHTNKSLSEKEELEISYQVAIRIIMRLVVILFAEARELLPKSMDIYEDSYGIEALYSLLEQAHQDEGSEMLQHNGFTWSRLIALFRTIYNGSAFSDMPIPHYGGELFKPGDQKSSDPVLRALAIFEDERWAPSDMTVLHILRLLKKGRVKVRRGRSTTWVKGPVDFSEMGTEYIGIMYEGLLDYSLKRCSEEDGAIIFLNLGQQPALPLTRLESLSERDLKNLIEKLRKEKITTIVEEEDSEDIEEEVLTEEDEEADEETEIDEDELTSEKIFTKSEELYNRIMEWAEKAVEIGKIIRKPTGRKRDLTAYEKARKDAAKNLINNIIPPGKSYLVRGGGNRKGTGTFYTKPQLVVPTVHKTLEPLVYRDQGEEKIPREPKEILNLKIVDPAMGSASFLVVALRYITNALAESLVYYGNMEQQNTTKTVIIMPLGSESKGEIIEVLPPVKEDDEQFERMLRALLKRYVVENCIYGVDVNPLAVELAKLALWVETLDKELPFTFLDHKLKVGNSLVGCWFDYFQDYPAMAWQRDAGDENHNTAVNFKKGGFSKLLKKMNRETVREAIAKYIRGMGPNLTLFFAEKQEKAKDLHKEISTIIQEMRGLKFEENGVKEREEIYKNRLLVNPNFIRLKEAFDLWCAIWFWPIEDIESAPLPKTFSNPSERVLAKVKDIKSRLRFFHWELEFPDVFVRENSGFDAVLGNPPWETIKPVSKEFFSEYDPIYRAYGKQEALKHQKILFEGLEETEREWVLYNADIKAMSNWCKNVGFSFGDPEESDKNSFTFYIRGEISANRSRELHSIWRKERQKREGFLAKNHPFRYHGYGSPTTYRLFLELGMYILRKSGFLGIIVPSSIYTDQGALELREYFVNNIRWDWLIGFENRRGIFSEIHKSFKFCILVLKKGEETKEIKTTFMRHDAADLEREFDWLAYPKEEIEKFSPKYLTFIEFQTQKDKEILEKIYSNSQFLESSDQWKIEYIREFDMTNDSKLFQPLPRFVEKGYEPTIYNYWQNKEDQTVLPLYEGRMVGQFDFSKKRWISGKGRTADWQTIPFEEKKIGPQYLMDETIFLTSGKAVFGYKIGFLNTASSTNTRSMICFLNRDYPQGNSAPLFKLKSNDIEDYLLLCGILNSFVYDFAVRCRLGGTSLNWYILEDTPLPLNLADFAPHTLKYFILNVARLSFITEYFSMDWLVLAQKHKELFKERFKSLWAVTPYERLRLRCIVDALAAEFYGLSYDDLAWILRKDPSNSKGFWRVDKEKSEEIRQTTLTLIAFQRLKEVGLEQFCSEEWQFPPAIQDQLGSRYLDWQLEGTPEDSWEDCTQHAINLFGEKRFNWIIEEIQAGHEPLISQFSPISALEVSKVEPPSKKVAKQKDLGDYLS